MEAQTKRTWAEVSMARLAHNYNNLRALAPQSRYLGLVKADAYGHGAVPVAKELEKLGADYLGVACLDEAIEVREAGVKTPILILGCTPEAYAEELVKYNITQACYNLDFAKALSAAAVKAGGTITVHIQCDTGMTRLGFQCDEKNIDKSEKEILEAVKLPGLKAEGIFTHFADSVSNEEYTLMQFNRFMDIVDRVKKGGYAFTIRHCANSGATLLYPFTYLDMIRPGIVQFGQDPGGNYSNELCDLVPVLELKSRIATIRDVPANTPVSYGCTHVLTRDSKIAVVPIGYGDGFHRSNSNKFALRIHGVKAPITGLVCMDMCMVDVTDIPEAREGDEVIVYGSEANPRQSINKSARLSRTINYELLCNLAKRVHRVYI